MLWGDSIAQATNAHAFDMNHDAICNLHLLALHISGHPHVLLLFGLIQFTLIKLLLGLKLRARCSFYRFLIH